MSAEEIAAKFAERNRLQRKRARYFRKKGRQERLQHSRMHLPTIQDPSMFAVKCKPSKEKDLVAQVYKKEKEKKIFFFLSIFF